MPVSGRWFPGTSKPLPVEGGLKARSARGAIGQTWWSGRFIAVLESIIVGGRLGRGRNYARRGQVISLDVGPGMVSALVQGSMFQPYRVRVGLTAFGKPEWARLERALADSAWYSAKLLAGEMPEDIEEVFGQVGLALFPASSAELAMECSCPDWQVPCKHIAAVFYLLAEAFDDDPFAILAWRGRDREELLANLHVLRAAMSSAAGPGAEAGSGSVASGGSAAGGSSAAGPPAGVPLADCLSSYFAMPAPLPVTRPAATSSAALLDQLPEVTIVVRGRPLLDLLHPAYLAFGERPEMLTEVPAGPPGPSGVPAEPPEPSGLSAEASGVSGEPPGPSGVPAEPPEPSGVPAEASGVSGEPSGPSAEADIGDP